MGTQKSLVAVVPCDDYEEERVYAAMRAGIARLGGIRRFASPDEQILVKPNFLSAASVDSAVTTHPSVIRAMLRLLSEAGCGHVRYGDSPGHGTGAAAAAKLGLHAENTYGARLAEMSEEVVVEFPGGIAEKSFPLAREAAEADAIFNLCKMKTHALERVTGAVKNVYGLVCGYKKAAGHVKYPNASVFARMLADIHRLVRPRLHIMDGIVAMEGNGPAGGVPVPMRVLLFSEDPVALDATFCKLVYLDPELVPTNAQGAAMGIGTYLEDEIQIVLCEACESGAPAHWRTVSAAELCQRFGNPSFDVDREGTRRTFLGGYSEVMTKLARRPYIDGERCVKCGICVSHCPVPGGAVRFKNGKSAPPVYDYKKCIRCYCCQEMCPAHAISTKRSWWAKAR